MRDGCATGGQAGRQAGSALEPPGSVHTVIDLLQGDDAVRWQALLCVLV